MPEDQANYRLFLFIFFIGAFFIYLPWFLIVIIKFLPDFLQNYQYYLSNNIFIYLIEFIFILCLIVNSIAIVIELIKKKKKEISHNLLGANLFSFFSCIIIIVFFVFENQLNFVFLWGIYCLILFCIFISQINYLKDEVHYTYDIPFPKGSIFKGHLSTKIIKLLNKNKKHKLIFLGAYFMEENLASKKPEYYKDKFICPFCEEYVSHKWHADILENNRQKNDEIFTLSRCENCKQILLWSEKLREIIYPNIIPISKPNKDMDEEIKNLYIEASKIFKESPRGAAALLRLSLEKLLIKLKIPGRDLNEKIKILIKEGIDENIRKACDIVRIYGNYAVHPKEIDLNDNIEIAQGLFWLINKIANIKITEKKKIDTMFSELPKSFKNQIERRDKIF